MESKRPLSPFAGDSSLSHHASSSSAAAAAAAAPASHHTRFPSPSALRALTSSPTQRLGLRRSRRDSCSTASTSIDPAVPVSCVTRETSRDECALHRFIVWAAVQRNACHKMTPSERLECPLLRCRKRFPSHELMLKHLYTCELLPTGEYWCYDCERAERFTDGKCKRCLGHPGKRRKIMSLAKNFFSSLGHKSRKDGTIDHDMEDAAAMPPPPSYDSLVIHPQEVELLSTEIVEIDSIELPMPPARSEWPQVTASSAAPPLPSTVIPALHMGPAPGTSAELESMPTLAAPLVDWELSSPLHTHDLSILDAMHQRGNERPSLQVTTYGLGHYQAKTRSKKLSPSSSLRSTNSTDSNASTGISPTSAWSGAWTMTSGFDTDLTSPTSELVSPGGLVSRGVSNASRRSHCDSLPLHDMISELPADYPLPQPIPQTLPPGLCHDQAYLSFDSSAPTDLSLASNDIFAETSPTSLADLVDASQADVGVPSCCIDADSLVGSAWDTLQAHIASSVEKLRHLDNNPLADQLRCRTPNEIASAGLATLKAILHNQIPSSAIDMLCFVHVTYSLSLVIHESDAQTRSKQLFAQAYSYSTQFLLNDQAYYVDAASAIWQPLDLSQTELNELLLARYSGSISRSGSLKGKDRAVEVDSGPANDSLLEVAQFFLDELEFAALPGMAPRSLEVLTSDLWTQHLKDVDVDNAANSAFGTTFRILSRMISQEFTGAVGLSARLDDFCRRIMAGSISSVRRAELELLQAGKGCMPSEQYFDSYVPSIRLQCNMLYKQNIPAFTARTTYYGYGINLMESIISALSSKAIPPSEDDSNADPGSLDDFIQSFTNGFDDDALDELLQSDDLLLSPDEGDNSASTVIGPVDGATLQTVRPTTEPASSLAGSSVDPEPEVVATTEGEQKIEAHDCCEICGYRPKGAPQWFKGSMAKHKKLQHATTPPKIYRCPYPGCTSQYKNRPDNLRQHQLDKGHFVDGEGSRRPSKRKKVD